MWGKDAQGKEKHIKNHLILKGIYPFNNGK